VKKFLSLDSSERLLLLQTFLFVWIASTTLRLLPFAIVQRLFASRVALPGRMHRRRPIERLLWAIAVAGRHVPGTTCLSLALAGRIMLNRYGYPAHIHIGVAKDHTGSFAAHAWLESEGTIVIGGQESTSLFAPLGVIGGSNPL
jgi:5-enolpyruvylshikimate-3-phosphate synthase